MLVLDFKRSLEIGHELQGTFLYKGLNALDDELKATYVFLLGLLQFIKIRYFSCSIFCCPFVLLCWGFLFSFPPPPFFLRLHV